MNTNNEKYTFIDQVLTGFDKTLDDFGVGEWLQKRQAILDSKEKIEFVLEFCEVSVDSYENLVSHVPGKFNDVHDNILVWRSPNNPSSLQYYNQSEFAQLVKLLKQGGVDRVMVRTFFTFEGMVGYGRFLRNENTPHNKTFEWRRADEFMRRHPEVRDPKTMGIMWDNELREDPIYNIEAGLTVGQWWTRQLTSFFSQLGVDMIRLGDNSYTSWEGGPVETHGADKLIDIHKDVYAKTKEQDIKLLTSIGPYWSFDAWDHNQEADITECDKIADFVLTQPLEGWTDKYGVMYVHNGEYFNAGSSNIHGLVNGAVCPQANFIRGLDSGDIIENWNPPVKMAIRETFDALTHYSNTKDLRANYQGVYHFWSDKLESEYYNKQAELLNFLSAHKAEEIDGPVLAVDTSKKPHNYTMGDFFESCGYSIRQSAPITDLPDDAPVVLFLPRPQGADQLMDETAMTMEETESLRELLESDRDIIMFGGSLDPQIMDSFGVEFKEGEFEPKSASCTDSTSKPFFCHAEASYHEDMAGTREKYFRKDYLKFVSNEAKELAVATDVNGDARTLASINLTESGASRIFISGLPENIANETANMFMTESCNLGYKIETKASVNSSIWKDREGRHFLAITRYDKWSDEPEEVMISSNSTLKSCFTSSAQLENNTVTIESQGVIILELC